MSLLPSWAPLLVAAVAAAWAALLAIADEAPGVSASLGDPPAPPGSPMPLARALRIARVTLLLLAAVAAGATIAWWRRAPVDAAAAVTITTLLFLLIGEVLPRAIGVLAPRAAAHTLPLARASLAPFRPLLGIMAPADRLAQATVPARGPQPGVLGAAQRDMLLGVFSLADTTVEDIMTPRLDIIALEATQPWHEIVEVVRQSEHSRLPVFRAGLDDIAGILYAKDIAPVLTGTHAPPATWHDLVRPVPFIPESKSLSAQLRDFQRGGAHIAIVVDEFGGTSGLVTLEDVLEEIVGEIHDEYDTDEGPAIEREGNDRFWVDGRVTLDDLSATLAGAFEHEEVSTVGGLIYSELGRVPRPGEELRLGGFRVVVEQIARRRIRRVYFERLASEPLAGLDAGRTHGGVEDL
ncbi:MAG: hemolysin family protein [Gemmatimonadota bacterium]|nr:hemolysin family protein [Gemmatimonadota bacterium]